MKRIFKLCSLLFTGLLLSGCVSYNSEPGKMEELQGTYELTDYTFKKDGEEEQIDYIKDKHAKSYLVISPTGYGYTTYQDDETDFYIDTIRIKFIYDSEVDEQGNATPTELISKINYTRGISDSAWSPKEGRLELGFNRKNKSLNINALNTKFNFGHGVSIGNKFTMHVNYKKVNDATDLTYLDKVIKEDLPELLPFEQKVFDNAWYRFDYYNDDINPYYYQYFKTDIKNNKMMHYSLLKEGLVKENKEESFSLTKTDDGYEFVIQDFKFTLPYMSEEQITGKIAAYLSSQIRYYNQEAGQYVEEASDKTIEIIASMNHYSQNDEEMAKMMEDEYNSYLPVDEGE